MRRPNRHSRRGCGEKLAEFCRTTDLHGYKYIVMPDLTVHERCFWALAVFACMVSAGYLVITAWHWFSRNPTVTVIESTHGAIWDVPFPAVIICDLNLVSRRAARTFADNLNMTGNVTRDEIFAFLRFVPLYSSSFRISDEVNAKLTALQAVLDMNNITIDALFHALNPSPCTRLVQRCMWKNTIYRCDDLFEPIVTHYMACCAFNYFAVDTADTNSSDVFRPKSPRHVASCGYQSALNVLINVQPEDYYSTTFASYGAVVFVDSVYNVPDKNSPLRLVNPQTEVFIAISPERTYATKGIAGFAVSERGCLFGDEESVGVIKTYSYHNCLIYRKSLSLAKTCGCIPHNFPRNNTVRMCNFHDLLCLQSYEGLYSRKERIRKFRVTGINEDAIRNKICLPECEHFNYPLEVAVGRLARHNPLNGLAFFKDVHLRNHSLVNIFFNDLVSTKFRRDVYLNWQNLLASFGGLLGLLLGFTLISGVDIVIFIFFKVLFNGVASVAPEPNDDLKGMLKVNFNPMQSKMANVTHKKEAWKEIEKNIKKKKFKKFSDYKNKY